MLHSRLLNRYAASYYGFSKAVWLITMAAFFNAIGQIMAVFFSLYLKNLGFSIHTIGLAITLFGGGYLVGGYISGTLCDKVHPKYLVSYSMLANSLFMFGFLFSSNLYYIYIMLILCGISGSSTRPASIMLIHYSVHQDSRSRALGLRRVGINLGMGLAAALGGYIVQFSFDLIFILAGASTFMASICLIKSEAFNAIEREHSTNDTKDSCAKKNPPNVIRQFWIIAVIYFLVVIIFSQMRATYPIYLTEHYHSGTHLFAALFALNCFLIVTIEVPLLSLFSRVKQYIVAAFGALFIGLGFGMLPLSHHPDFTFLSMFIWTIGEILFFPTLINFMLTIVRVNQGKYVGLYQTFFAAGTLVSPLIGTTLYSIDNGNVLWYLCGILGMILFVQTLKLLR